MGEVALTFKVMPDGLEIDLTELKEAIEKDLSGIGKLQGTEEQPVAFGLKALLVKIVVEDADGIMDKLESTISGINGVQSAEITEMGRLL